MAGLYGEIVALCNQYLREHDMLTNSSKFILGVLMFAGFYLREFGIRNTIKKLNRQLEKAADSFGNVTDV
jgi:uncharacterized membrane protein YciS (DUF1049 family)